MLVAIAGGHGQIALHLTRMLNARGDRVRSLIRNPDHGDDVREAGGEPVVCDLEAADDQTVAQAVEGSDAVVFAAGAGPGSGPERKRTVDYGAAVKLVEAAREDGVRRYVMLSAMGASDPDSGSEQMRPYLTAKAEADWALAKSGLDHTIVRPGRLTDDPGTGLVEAAGELGHSGEISREDTAAVLLATLGADETIGKTFEVLAGETPIDEAVRSL
jgi:uncharacterized protein YbjT (DUF2867 family)